MTGVFLIATGQIFFLQANNSYSHINHIIMASSDDDSGLSEVQTTIITLFNIATRIAVKRGVVPPGFRNRLVQ